MSSSQYVTFASSSAFAGVTVKLVSQKNLKMLDTPLPFLLHTCFELVLLQDK